MAEAWWTLRRVMVHGPECGKHRIRFAVTPKVGAERVKGARSDLCGGGVTGIPPAIVGPVMMSHSMPIYRFSVSQYDTIILVRYQAAIHIASRSGAGSGKGFGWPNGKLLMKCSFR